MASRTAYSMWTPQKPTLFDGHYLCNRSTLDKGVLGYIGIVQHKEHSPEVLSIPSGTPCILVILTHYNITSLNVPIAIHTVGKKELKIFLLFQSFYSVEEFIST